MVPASSSCSYRPASRPAWGAQVPIEVIVESTAQQPALVTLRRNGEPVGTLDVLLEVGTNRFTFTDDPGDTGVISYSATVDTAGDSRPQNDTARTTVDIDGPAQVLLVEGTAEAGDALDIALRSTGLEVDVISAEALPSLDHLIAYDSIVLADVSLDQLSDDQIQSVVTATRQLGRGLLTIGGPQSYGMGSYRDSELEQVLPVISDVLDPQRLRQVAQVMALDTSESMGECHCADGFEQPMGDAGGVNKTEIARAGAARAISNLNANDEIGVLAVDTQERWLIDLQQLPSDDVINSGLAEAVPSGNTELSGTLPTAADALRQSNAALKHIILFTDGFTSQGDLERMRTQAADIRADGITVSVVATGEGAARELAAIAEAGGGRFYPGRDLTRIPEILVQESILASRQFITEGEFLPVITDSSPVVDSLSVSPPLLGYVATTSKDTSRTLLRIGPEEDPLLASWQVGLGRATSWTSDASPRWSQFWTGWDGYVDFWSSVVRDTFPVQTSGAVRTSVDGDTLRIRAEAEPGQGRVDAIVRGSAIASVSYAAEYRPGPADETLLQRISEVSGGRGAIDAAQAFDADALVSGRRSIDLANWFLLAAALAWLAAVVFSRLWLRRSQVSLAEAGAPSVPNDTPRPRRGFRRSAGADTGNVQQAEPAERPLRSWERVPKTERPRRMPPPPNPSAPGSTPTPPPPPSAPPPPPPSAATVNELLKARRERNDE